MRRVHRSLTVVLTAVVAALLCLPDTKAAQNPLYQPSGISDGESYHLVFATEGTYASIFQDIAEYNYSVNNEAAASTLGIGLDTLDWFVVGSTKVTGLGDAEAKDNAPVFGDVYRVDGVQVSDESGAAKFYQSAPITNHLAPINIDQHGALNPGYYVWTGSNVDGTRTSKPLGEDTTYQVTMGAADLVNASWINHNTTPASTPYKLYALSEPLVGGSPPTPPTPPTPQPLSRGHQILVERGLQIQALTFPGLAGDFDTYRWAESNFTTAHIWSLYSLPGTMPGPNGIPWSNWVWPGSYPEDIEPALQPYANNAFAYQFGDEQDITDPTEQANLKAAMAAFHVNQPDVITYTNQTGMQASPVQMQAYMQEVQPDMLSFDRYPFYGYDFYGDTLADYYWYRNIFYRDLEMYRKLGLAGNDGTGSQPIPVATYTQTFNFAPGDHVASESEIRLNQFAAWVFGVKVVDSFFYEAYPGMANETPIRPILFSGTGTDNPTPQFYQVAETNRQSLNLGPALVRLLSTDVRMVMGQHVEDSVTVDNDLPEGVSRWDSDADPYITSITATNLDSKNNGLAGDVIMGYFEPLDASFTNPGFQDDMYFMVVNGLSDINGLAADAEQLIHIEFDFGTSGIDSLERLSRDTGLVEPVTLTHDSGSLYNLDLVLEGGTGDLFKFNNGGDFVSGPSVPTPLGTAFLWTADGAGEWATASSWTPQGPPNGPTHTAIFSSGVAEPTTAVVNTAVTVNRVEFSNATHGYAVGGLGSVNLVLDPDDPNDPNDAFGPPLLSVTAGSHQFQTVVNLDHDTVSSIATGASLMFANTLNLNGNTLAKTGGGTLIISNALNTGGGTITGLGGVIAGSGVVVGNLNNAGSTIAPGNISGGMGAMDVPEPAAGLLGILGAFCLLSTVIWRPSPGDR